MVIDYLKIQYAHTMTSQRFSFLLILIMAITPVTSVFGYYSEIASQLSVESSFLPDIAAAENDTGDAATHNSDQCHQHNNVKTVCHASSNCSFHVCGDGGITAVFLFLQRYSSYLYRHLEKSIANSLSFPPDIRPPISSL